LGLVVLRRGREARRYASLGSIDLGASQRRMVASVFSWKVGFARSAKDLGLVDDRALRFL
jgi:hypothetical protein